MLFDEIPIISQLSIKDAPRGQITRYWLHLTEDGMGNPVVIPLIVARGYEDGHVLGITAALHGNELNGISVVRQLFKQLDINNLRGTVVGVPVTNAPALFRRQRMFTDGMDLNRIMPGKRYGRDSEVYAYRLVSRLVTQFTILLDLHTATAGHTNPYYIRAEMQDERIATLARLQNAEIIVNTHGDKNRTLRHVAAKLGIIGLTSELCDPGIFQKEVIQSALIGVMNTLVHLDMIDGEVVPPKSPAVECKESYWLYAQEGGILEVFPTMAEMVKRGDVIAQVTNIFGDLIREYTAPEDGIIIGKSVRPVNQSGGRILRLGIVG